MRHIPLPTAGEERDRKEAKHYNRPKTVKHETAKGTILDRNTRPQTAQQSSSSYSGAYLPVLECLLLNHAVGNILALDVFPAFYGTLGGGEGFAVKAAPVFRWAVVDILHRERVELRARLKSIESSDKVVVRRKEGNTRERPNKRRGEGGRRRERLNTLGGCGQALVC